MSRCLHLCRYLPTYLHIVNHFFCILNKCNKNKNVFDLANCSYMLVGRCVGCIIICLSFHVSDLMSVYNNLVFQNHGKNLEHLENEEMKLTDCIVRSYLFESNLSF